jgi:capsular polysaccharide transport system permease protein
MTNEERIQKWLERSETALPEERETKQRRARRDLPDHAERITMEALSPARPMGEASLEQARIDILARRRARWHQLLGRLALFGALPLLIIFAYVKLAATPLYQGEAVFTVQTSTESAPSPTAGLFSIGGAGSTIADAFKAREFILSRPMMNYMQQRYGYLDHFRSAKMDPLTRLSATGDPYGYYLKRVKVAVDVQEGILRLYVQARTQQDAIRFGNGILAAAETHVNDLSHKITNDQISALTQDVQEAERQVAESGRSLAAVQARRGEFNPEQSATAVYQLISQLELQQSDAQRQRNGLIDQGLTNSPLLPQLDARISELKGQIAEQRQRLVNPGGTSLSTTLNEFQGATARKEIAQARWQSALNTLQQAYLRTLQDRRYFVVIVGMSAAGIPEVRDVLPIALPILAVLLVLGLATFAVRRALARVPNAPTGRAVEVFSKWRR